MTLPVATRQSTERRQAEIVAAALRLACEASPAQITTAHIAAAIQVTQGAVFKHFPTKEAIWLAAMRWVHQTLLHTLSTAAAQAASPLDALSAVFTAHIHFVIDHPGVPRFIFHELQQPADSAAKQEVRMVLQDYRRLLLDLLSQAVRLGLVPAALDQEAAATSFVGLVQGLVMQSMLTGQPAAMREHAERVFSLYLCGLRVAS
jgi:AcrR family transcriptional regulator